MKNSFIVGHFFTDDGRLVVIDLPVEVWVGGEEVFTGIFCEHFTEYGFSREQLYQQVINRIKYLYRHYAEDTYPSYKWIRECFTNRCREADYEEVTDEEERVRKGVE